MRCLRNAFHGSSSRTVTTASEDARAALDSDSLASIVPENIDTSDQQLADALAEVEQESTWSAGEASMRSTDFDNNLDDYDSFAAFLSSGDHMDVLWPINNQYCP